MALLSFQPNLYMLWTVTSICMVGVLFLTILLWHHMRRRRSHHQIHCINGVQTQIIDDVETCNRAIAALLSTHPPFIGFDCEWKPCLNGDQNVHGNNHKVALIQLSDHRQCLLIQIHKICAHASTTQHDGHAQLSQFPLQLLGFLANPSIIKVGVNITGDAHKLYTDYNVSMRGTVEITHFIQQKCAFHSSIDTAQHNLCRLDALVRLLLRVEMNKRKHITLSNWENEHLSSAQIEYAANDAIMAYHSFLQCVRHRHANSISTIAPFFNSQHGIDHFLRDHDNLFFVQICYGIIDLKNKKLEEKMSRQKILQNSDLAIAKHTPQTKSEEAQKRLLLKQERKKIYKQRASRSKPLYENCRLLDLNGSLIAHCSSKTLQWYLKKDLAVPVSEDSIKLKFTTKKERSSSDRFYQTLKQNVCVVCGASHGLVKYYVVPQCYRKHLPVELKAHSSHDIVLLCHDCHELTAKKEDRLRTKLSQELQVTDWKKPIGFDPQSLQISKAAKTYLKCGNALPSERRREILDALVTHFGLQSEDDVNDELLNQAINLIPSAQEINKLKQQQFATHAAEMVRAMNGDFAKLIQTWRQHFVEEMKPKYLPKHWSIDSEY